MLLNESLEPAEECKAWSYSFLSFFRRESYFVLQRPAVRMMVLLRENLGTFK